MYQEIKPSKRLRHIIDSFWTFSNNKTSKNYKVLPDACSDLIFDFNRNKSFLSGIMTNYQLRELGPESNLMGVRFKTEKFGSLSKIPPLETKNLRIELAHVFSAKNLTILNRLSDLEKITDKVALLENFMDTSFRQNEQRQDQMIISVAQHIRSMHGMVPIGDLAKSHHISLRQLQRRFKNYIGLTTKEFSNIVRFKHAKKVITNFKETSLLAIAFDTGFYDHSHMTHEFNRISGENPSYFR